MKNRLEIRLILSSLSLLFAMGSFISTTQAMTLEEACGNASESLSSFSRGQWLPWSDDHLDQEGLDRSVIETQNNILTKIAEPFQHLKVLNPPPGVEARLHRSMGQKTYMGESGHGARLMLQLFHPTFKIAVESSAGVKVFVNDLSPLFYGIGGGEIKDSAGPIFSEPIRVGELGGADVYWSERQRDCIAVFNGNQRALWEPVSQKRYLLAQIKALEGKSEDALKEFKAEQRKQSAESTGPDLAEQEEMLKLMRAINPEAAKELEKQLADMRRLMAEKMPEIRKEIDREFEKGAGVLDPAINKFKAELAAMSPAERAAPAYWAGINGSKTTLLSHPDDAGSRALVAPTKSYFSKTTDPQDVQLLIVEFASYAAHAPETAIMTRMRKELDWRQFWRFVGK